MAKSSLPTWSQLKPVIVGLDRESLTEMLRVLYAASADNRTFVAVRLLAPGDRRAALEEYRQQVIEPFYPKRGSFGKLNFAAAKRAIRSYRKASGDLDGTAELMLTYVESGVRFANEYGSGMARLETSVASVLNDLATLLASPDGAAAFSTLEPRLRRLVRQSGDIWGLGAEIDDQISTLFSLYDV